MRTVGLFLFAVVAVTLIAGTADVCCADEDGCSRLCVCVCCSHSGLYIDSSFGAGAVLEAAPIPVAVSPILISFLASPDFPPPEA